jgi:hypothetical protein
LDAFAASSNQLIAQLDSKDFQDQLRQSLQGVDAAAIQREMEQAQKEMQKQLPSTAEMDGMIADAQRIGKSFDAEQKEFAKSLLGFNGKTFQKQMDEFKKTMPNAFSPQKIEEFQHQMEQLQKEFEMQSMD